VPKAVVSESRAHYPALDSPPPLAGGGGM